MCNNNKKEEEKKNKNSNINIFSHLGCLIYICSRQVTRNGQALLFAEGFFARVQYPYSQFLSLRNCQKTRPEKTRLTFQTLFQSL